MQISSGKFVNFDSLLPNTSPLTMDEYTIKVNSGADPSLSLVPKAQNRPRVIDFYTWLTAWNNFLQAMSFYHPMRVPELIRYQSLITNFACQYQFSSWSTYDQLFRYHMANDPSLSWADVHDDLFNRYLRGAPLRTMCYSCRNFGHITSNCPLRPNRPVAGASNFPPQSMQSSTFQQPPFRAPQRSFNSPQQPTRS